MGKIIYIRVNAREYAGALAAFLDADMMRAGEKMLSVASVPLNPKITKLAIFTCERLEPACDAGLSAFYVFPFLSPFLCRFSAVISPILGIFRHF